MVQFYYLKGNNMPPLSKWIFQSMTTITKAQKELTLGLAPYVDRVYMHDPQSVVYMLADTKGLFQC